MQTSIDRSRIIELVGFSGIGKTTCYRQLQGIVRPGQRWACFEDQLVRAPVSGIASRIRALLGKPEVLRESSAQASRFAAGHGAFVANCWRLLANNHSAAGDLINFRLASLFLKAFSVTQHVAELATPRVTLVDEGLIKRLMSLQLRVPNLVVEDAVATAPLPLGVVLIEASMQTAVERALSRRDAAAMYGSRSVEQVLEIKEREADLIELVLGVIARRGVAIERLSAEVSPVELARSARIALDRLAQL